MPVIHTPKLLKPRTEGAGERVRVAAEELERLGVAGATGKRVRKDLPRDMREETDRDFGG